MFGSEYVGMTTDINNAIVVVTYLTKDENNNQHVVILLKFRVTNLLIMQFK